MIVIFECVVMNFKWVELLLVDYKYGGLRGWWFWVWMVRKFGMGECEYWK